MYKRIYCIVLVSFLAYACQNDNKQRTETGSKNEISEATPSKEKLLVLPWKAEYNPETEKLELKHVASSDMSNLTDQDIIDALNLKYPDIKLEKIGRNKDTIFVAIPNAVFLTQQAGSAGAESYLAEATFSLTELKNIKAVNFKFKEGDHAVPKTYSRKDFRDFN
ncbi:hypothetical protein [Rubrolithibacter danxiaensis]|uniref:hypothetical protein n=1 Tax=Rubrolithibacter danxiaensis TaxID=3390805 RepID=UPI003BF921C4